MLDLLQHVHVSLVLGIPDLDTPLQRCSSRGEDSPTSSDLVLTLSLMQPGSCWLPMPQGHFAFSRSTWCPPGAPGPLLQSCFPAKHHPACTGDYLGFLPPPGQVSAFSFALLQDILAGQDLQPLDVPLNGSTIIWCTKQSYFCYTCKSAEGLPCPAIQVVTEDVKQYWPQYQPL